MNGKPKAISPRNLGWLEYKLSDKEMDYVWRCIKNKKKKINDKLVGQISGSYLLEDRGDWFWMNLLKPMCNQYAEDYENILERNVTFSQKHPYYMDKWWVNYQKQGEFNPFHKHNGVYSFVIWMKIPTEHEKQNRNNPSNCQFKGVFEFTYTNILGDVITHPYNSSSKLEGIMLFFPAGLHHQVYPFYNCDEDRISVSGNVMCNTAKTI